MILTDKIFSRYFRLASLVFLLLFIVVAFGCGSSLASSPLMTHGDAKVCTNMLADNIVFTQEESVIALFLALIIFSQTLTLVVQLSLLNVLEILRRSMLRHIIVLHKQISKLNDIIIFEFSSGILHSKVY